MEELKISDFSAFLLFLREKGWGDWKIRTLERMFYEWKLTKSFRENNEHNPG